MRRSLSILFGLLAATSCNSPTEVAAVASVEVTPSVTTMASAGTLQLSVRALDQKGADLNRRDVIWSSSNTAVATIASTGLVTAGRILTGTSQQTTITALIGGVAGTATLTVTPVPVASVTISPASITLRPGQTLQLSAYPVDNTGTPLTGRTINWSTSDTLVFTVSPTGLLRGSAYAGTSTRSATISAGAEGQSASVLASVQPSIVASVGFVDSLITRYPNQVFQVNAVVRDSSGFLLTGRAVAYSSSDTAVAIVSPVGVVTTRPYSGGQTRRSTVTATFEGRQGTMVVSVVPTPVSRVTITPDSVLMAPLRGVQLVVATADSVGSPLTGRSVTWKSNDTTIAVVTTSGEVTTKALSTTSLKTTTITATVEQKVGSARIVVSPYLTDPGELNLRMTGAVQDWFNTQSGMTGNAPMLTAAQTYTSSWNNWDMNYYSSLDADGTRRTRPWKNETPAVSGLWEGFYRSYGKASDVLDAIRLGGASLGSLNDNRAAEVLATLTRGAAIAGLALNYDRAVLSPSAVGPMVNRKVMRDAALVVLDSVITLAAGQAGTVPAQWVSGQSYTIEQLARVANTMAAHLLANWPRMSDENAQVDWARVVAYASKGISSQTPFDFQFVGDGCSTWCPEILVWFNALDTGRLHTRVANMLDGSQQTPWPTGGNPQPNALDKRLGDGSFGNATMISGFGTVPRTANGGSDFAYSSQAIFNMARGSYHQSNIGHVRYDASGTQSTSGIYYGYGNAPLYSAGQNDLLWAEGLLRTGGDLSLAAALINKTRVNRGGREPATSSAGVTILLGQLALEIELEQLGLGASPFYFRRRVSGLIEGTPFEMPVPAAVMIGRGETPYTFGGPYPAASNTPP